MGKRRGRSVANGESESIRFTSGVSGCGKVIAAGRSAYVAIAYYDRALTHAKKGEHDLAVTDFA